MYDIPRPELLDPDRVDRDDRENFTAEDHRSQAQLLSEALEESCAYATQLWEQLDVVRAYLLQSLPPESGEASGASPTGPDDEQGWHDWIEAFAGTSSVLCGSHGDSGFGLSRAHEEARLRRAVPRLTTVGGTGHSEPLEQTPGPEPTRPWSESRTDIGTKPVDAPSGRDRAGRSLGRTLAATAVGVLALRGLRPRPRAARPRSTCDTGGDA